MINTDKGIYIHIPFCASKCAYCDFVSYAGMDSLVDSYFEALFRQIELFPYDGAVNTVYFGGGTPSYVDACLIAEALEKTAKRFTLGRDCEISLEANPNSLSPEKLKVYKAAGINRISMGAQSMDNDILRLIGRAHRRNDIIRAAEDVQKAGFSNFNLDLMFSLPCQTAEDFEDTLKAAVDLGAPHISCYSLTLEENTPIYRLYEDGTYSQDDEADRQMYHTALEILASHGLKRYEISNFALPGMECRHNTDCWDFCSYAGFGAAACSFLGNARLETTGDIGEYIRTFAEGTGEWDAASVLYEETAGELAEDYIMLALRKASGLDEADFSARFGEDFREKYQDIINETVSEGLAEEERGFYRLTDLGFDFAGYVTKKFL